MQRGFAERAKRKHMRGFRAIFRDVQNQRDWMVDGPVRCQVLSVNRLTVDKAVDTDTAGDASGSILKHRYC
jgi:hypothetical protein